MRIFLFFILMLIKMCFSVAVELENDIPEAEVKTLPSLNSFENEELLVAMQVVQIDLRSTIGNIHPAIIIAEENTEEERPSRSFCGMCCCSLFKLPGSIADVFSPLAPFASFQSIASQLHPPSSRNSLE